MRNRTLARVALSEVPTRYPFFLAVEATTESILCTELHALGRTPPGGHRATAVSAHGGGCVVTGADRDAEPFQVCARYLVGADGLHAVRTLALAGMGRIPGRPSPDRADGLVRHPGAGRTGAPILSGR